MKILTWNINGIRAVQKDKTSLKTVLDSLGADVICLQETKVTRDMLDERTAVVDGFDSYFSFSRKKTGYSGTANFCKTEVVPRKAEEGLTGKLSSDSETNVCHYGRMTRFSDSDLQALDDEGRCVITQHRILLPTEELTEVAIINVYVPRAGDREDRHVYKLQFLTLLQLRAEAILKSGVHVIILGDLNTTHQKLDNCEPQTDEEFMRKSSRIWLNCMLEETQRDKSIPPTDANLEELYSSDMEGGHFNDVFRHLHPLQENAFTNWCSSTGARQTNYGRRLDYILIDTDLSQYVTHCEIMADVEGSDHCPVIVTLNCTPLPSSVNPSLCTKFMPEFRGQQKKLSSFFTKSNKSSHPIPVHKGDEPFTLEHEDLSRRTSMPNISAPPTKPNLKRNSTQDQSKDLKKVKLKKGVSSDSKQISLTSFFGPKAREKTPNKPTQNEICSHLVSKDPEPKENLSLGNNNNIHIEMESKNTKIVDVVVVDSVQSESNFYEDSKSSHKSTASSASAWKGLLSGLPPPPPCPGHKEPCVLRTVKKPGPNKNKQFYCCARPDGAPGNPESRCNFFQWVKKK